MSTTDDGARGLDFAQNGKFPFISLLTMIQQFKRGLLILKQVNKNALLQ
jgi:hypothetical protein